MQKNYMQNKTEIKNASMHMHACSLFRALMGINLGVAFGKFPLIFGTSFFFLDFYYRNGFIWGLNSENSLNAPMTLFAFRQRKCAT